MLLKMAYFIGFSILIALMSASLQAQSLQVVPRVVMTHKLKNSLIGRVVQRKLELFIGKTYSYTYDYRGELYTFSGKLKKIIVPDINNIITTDDLAKAELIGQFGEIVAVNHDGIGHAGSLVDQVPFSSIMKLNDSQIGHVVIVSDLLGDVQSVGRLVGEYQDTFRGDIHHEVLVEAVVRDVWQVTEPKLSLINVQDDRMHDVSRKQGQAR